MGRGYVSRSTATSLFQIIYPDADGSDLIAHINSINDLPPHTAVKWARAQKVIADLYVNLSQVNTRFMSDTARSWVREVCEIIQHDYEPWIATKRTTTARLQSAVELLSQVKGVNFMLVKGAGLVAAFGEEIKTRLVRDIDIIVPSQADFWKAHKALSEHGFALAGEAPWLQIRTVKGRKQIIGAASLEGKFKASDLELDLHWPGQCCGLMVGQFLPDWSCARRLSDNVFAPSPPDLLLFTLAHAQHHGYAIAKDLRDIYTFSNILSPHQWQQALSTISKLRLNPMLGWILKSIQQMWPVSLPSYLTRAARVPIIDRLLLARKLRALRHASRQPGNGLIYAWRQARQTSSVLQSLASVWASAFWLFESEFLWRVCSPRLLARWFKFRDQYYMYPEMVQNRPCTFIPSEHQPWREVVGKRAITAAADRNMHSLLTSHGFNYSYWPEHLMLILTYGSVELMIASGDIHLVSPNLLFTDEREDEIEQALGVLTSVCKQHVAEEESR